MRGRGCSPAAATVHGGPTTLNRAAPGAPPPASSAMSYPQGYLYQPPGSLALYSCPAAAYGAAAAASALAAPRSDELARSSSGSAFSPYPGSAAFTAQAAATGFSSPLQYSADPAAAGFPSYMVGTDLEATASERVAAPPRPAVGVGGTAVAPHLQAQPRDPRRGAGGPPARSACALGLSRVGSSPSVLSFPSLFSALPSLSLRLFLIAFPPLRCLPTHTLKNRLLYVGGGVGVGLALLH